MIFSLNSVEALYAVAPVYIKMSWKLLHIAGPVFQGKKILICSQTCLGLGIFLSFFSYLRKLQLL